jgi:hypothetical protein
MARQMKQPPKRDPADARGQAEPLPRGPKRRPAVEKLMAMSEDEIREWMRSVGLKSASDLGIRAE